MAINAGTEWEIRTTGNSLNGGGFYDLNPGTSVDYTQQDAAVFNPTDLTTDAAGTTLSSVTGGFTAAMVGNVINISAGTGFGIDRFQITAYTDTNNVTIDKSAGASATAGTGYVGGAFALGTTLDEEFLSDLADGNKIWFAAGTHNTGETASPNPGAANLYITFEGYNTTRGDHPTGSSRPVLQPGSGTGTWTFGGSTNINDMIFDSIYHNITSGTGNFIHNCKWFDSSDAETGTLMTAGNGSQYIECEFYGTSGHNDVDSIVSCGTSSATFYSCYFHAPSNTNGRGVYATSGVIICFGCVFANLAHGVYNSSQTPRLYSCTFYNCGTTGVYCAGNSVAIVNSIFHTCGVALNWVTAGYGDYKTFACSFYNNTTDISNGTLDDWSIFTDPKLVDPANGDYTLDSGSPCFDAGIGLGTHVGLAV